jgi:DNA-damage-inducible protein J
MAIITADTIVKARIDSGTKARATEALDAMGLSISDVIRIVLMRVADEQKLPFDVKVPSPALKKALSETRSGKARKFNTVDEVFAHLEI